VKLLYFVACNTVKKEDSRDASRGARQKGGVKGAALQFDVTNIKF